MLVYYAVKWDNVDKLRKKQEENACLIELSPDEES